VYCKCPPKWLVLGKAKSLKTPSINVCVWVCVCVCEGKVEDNFLMWSIYKGKSCLVVIYKLLSRKKFGANLAWDSFRKGVSERLYQKAKSTEA